MCPLSSCTSINKVYQDRRRTAARQSSPSSIAIQIQASLILSPPPLLLLSWCGPSLSLTSLFHMYCIRAAFSHSLELSQRCNSWWSPRPVIQPAPGGHRELAPLRSGPVRSGLSFNARISLMFEDWCLNTPPGLSPRVAASLTFALAPCACLLPGKNPADTLSGESYWYSWRGGGSAQQTRLLLIPAEWKITSQPARTCHCSLCWAHWENLGC